VSTCTRDHLAETPTVKRLCYMRVFQRPFSPLTMFMSRLAPRKGIRNLESTKFWALESGIRQYGIRNPETRNSGILHLESGIHHTSFTKQEILHDEGVKMTFLGKTSFEIAICYKFPLPTYWVFFSFSMEKLYCNRHQHSLSIKKEQSKWRRNLKEKILLNWIHVRTKKIVQKLTRNTAFFKTM